DDGQLVVEDTHFQTRPVDMPLSVLLGKPPKMKRTATRGAFAPKPFDGAGVPLHEALLRVLRLPTVADKTFLITIGDRSVTGLVARDQMVGPFQVPVADAEVTATAYDVFTGERMAMGERTPIALLDAAASARMAVGEAITNIVSAPGGTTYDGRLQRKWMLY